MNHTPKVEKIRGMNELCTVKIRAWTQYINKKYIRYESCTQSGENKGYERTMYSEIKGMNPILKQQKGFKAD